MRAARVFVAVFILGAALGWRARYVRDAWAMVTARSSW